MPRPAATRPALTGRVNIDHLDPLIQQAARQAQGTLTIDLEPYSGLAPSAFNQLLEACRSALEDQGKANADILLLHVPVTLRELHRRVAARHARTIIHLPDSGWRLEPR